MDADWKTIWDKLKADLRTSPRPISPELLERIDAAMAPVNALLKAFNNERNRQPFVSQAPCPICRSGTVTYRYREPLIGSMKCDTPDCISHNL
ncbi:MAG: hypothetical protein JWQ02_2793 [Capsulimonas sp.]|nr:hypothetical protein [Capsulimonas sp.]